MCVFSYRRSVRQLANFYQLAIQLRLYDEQIICRDIYNFQFFESMLLISKTCKSVNFSFLFVIIFKLDISHTERYDLIWVCGSKYRFWWNHRKKYTIYKYDIGNLCIIHILIVYIHEKCHAYFSLIWRNNIFIIIWIFDLFIAFMIYYLYIHIYINIWEVKFYYNEDCLMIYIFNVILF